MEIRQEQMDAFARVQEQELRKRLRDLLANRYPLEYEELGELEFEEVIAEGLKRARSYGIAVEKDLILYFHLMFNLALNFDTSPDYPWAAVILRSSDLSAEDKLRDLARRAQQALDNEAEAQG